MKHWQISTQYPVAWVRTAVAFVLIAFGGAGIALNGTAQAVQAESMQVRDSPLLLAQADTSSCNRGISSTGANVLFTQASLKYREAAAVPVEGRVPLYVEVLGLLDQIVRDYPHTDLACRIDSEGSLGRMNVAEMRRVVSEAANATLRYPVAGEPPSVSASFYDETYPNSWSPPAQHLGVDLPALAETTVMSPVTGTVVSNNTAVADPFNKRIVIKDERTGYEHVLGHLTSSLATGQALAIGDPVGEIVAAGTGPHVHWGVNVHGVETAIDVPGGWGWGRAPIRSTRDQAAARGWVDPLSLGPQTDAHPDPNLVVRNAESSEAPTAPQVAVDDARLPASKSLQGQFPETYAAIWEIPSGSNVAKETAVTALETLLMLAYSPELNDLMWSRLGVNAADLVGWATKNPERAVALSIENVGSNLAVSAATSVSAALVADSLFATQPMASIPLSWQNPLKALVRATIIEVAGLAHASSNPTAIVGPLVNRLIDVVEIYKASRALTKVIDQALVATALGLETAAQLAVDFPNARSQRVAEDTVADLLGRVREFAGKDDEAAVQEIGDLTYTALISQRRGDLQTARDLLKQIQHEGKLSSNIHPFSAITKPVDWLTAVARGGRDTPEQAANIMITATALRDLSAGWSAIEDCRKVFATVSVGESKCGYSLDGDGIVRFQEKNVFRFDQVSVDIVHTYNNGERLPAGTATRIKLLPQSPSGRFHIINACHYECGDVRLFDSKIGTTHRFSAGKYGPGDWIEWSGNENYALLYNSNEDAYWLHVVDTLNSRSYSYPDGRNQLSSIDLSQVEWVGPERFNAAINGEPKSAFFISGSKIEANADVAGTTVVGDLAAGHPRGLKKDGVFAFPQAKANVLFDTKKLRVSAWNDAAHLYVQAVLWTDGLNTLGKTEDGRFIGDRSNLAVDTDADGKVTPNVDRIYSLNPWPSLPGLRYSVKLGPKASTTIQHDSKGRGSIRYVETTDGKARVDSFVIPLAEIGRKAGEKIRFAYYGVSPKPEIKLNSIGYEPNDEKSYFADYDLPWDKFHELSLAGRPATLDLKKVPDDRDEPDKKQIERFRVAAEEYWKQTWKQELKGEDPLENITDLMRFDRATTIAELSKGRHIILTYRNGNVEFAQGKVTLSDYQRGTDIYEGIPEGGFSWEGWFDAMSAAQKRSFTVVCRLDADALVGLSDGTRYEFFAQLVSVADSDFMTQVVVDCAR